MAENAPVNKLVSLLSLRQSSLPPRLPTASLLASFTALLSPPTRTSLINYTPYLFINLCHMKDPLIKIKSFKFIKFLFSSLFASFVWRDGLRSLSVRDFSYKFSAPRRRLLSERAEPKGRSYWITKKKLVKSFIINYHTQSHIFIHSHSQSARSERESSRRRRRSYDGEAFSIFPPPTTEGLSNFFHAMKRKMEFHWKTLKEFYQFLKTCRKKNSPISFHPRLIY